MSEWISIKDELPEHGIEILIASKQDTICYFHVGFLGQDEIFYECIHAKLRIIAPTHWKSLEPPK